MDWKVLLDKIATYPKDAKAETIFTDITDKTKSSVAVDVSSKAVRALLYARGKWPGIIKLGNSAVTEKDVSGAAIAAQMLVTLTNDHDMLPMTNEGIAAALVADLQRLVDAGLIDQADFDAVIGLASVGKSWADENEWNGVSLHQIEYAMGDDIRTDTVLFPPKG